MGKIMVWKFRQLQSSTLTEVIVAMVILTIIILLSTSAYMKISTYAPEKKLLTHLILKDAAESIKNNGVSALDSLLIKSNYWLSFDLKILSDDSTLLKLELELFDSDSVSVGTYEEFILNHSHYESYLKQSQSY